VPIYNLKITLADKSSNESTLEISESFTKWFDEQGHFITTPFQELLATGIPLVGQLDPKRMRSKTQDLLSSSPEYLEALLAASPSAAKTPGSTASGAEPTPKKGGKRRKA
jgi:signal peptidase complex subunit 2